VREGAVANADSSDLKVFSVRQFCRQLKEKGFMSTELQTVGIKGPDVISITIER
jgi:hypothetical protein